MNLRAIAIVGIILLSGLATIVPTANAGHLPQTSPAIETAWQVSFAGGMVGSGSFTTSGNFNLDAGSTYAVSYSWGFTGGCSDTSGWDLIQNSNSTGLFRVVQGSGGTISPRGDVSYIDVIQQGINGNNHRYATVIFTSPITGSVSFNGFITSCSPSTTGPETLGFPTGVSSVTDLIGYQAHYLRGSTVVGVILKVSTQQSETGILSTQTQKSPANSKFTWTRVNTAQDLVNVAGIEAITPAAIEMAQSFTPNVALGRYLEISASRVDQNDLTNCGGGKVSVSIATELTSPWDTTKERANITGDFTDSTGSNTAILTADWLTGALSSDQSSFTIGSTFVRSIAGSTTTDLSAFSPFINGSVLYYRVVLWNTACTTDNIIPLSAATTNIYSGGTIWSNTGSGWTETAAKDAWGFVLKVYGGNTLEFRLNATSANPGGAFYTYFAEHVMDANALQSFPVSSWGGFPVYGNSLYVTAGGAGSPECSFGGVSTRPCQLNEFRLGYVTIPLNTTQTLTITLDTLASQRNLIYTGTLTNQPTTTHIGRTSFDNQAGTNPDLVTYSLLSSDDYQYSVFVRVVRCVTLDGSGLCAEPSTSTGYASPPYTIVPNGSYTGSIRGFRSISGTWSATGEFNFSGQDVGGGITTLSLAATNYVSETGIQVNIPTTPGNYFVNITLTEGSGAGLTVTTSGVSVTFSPSASCLTTGQSLAMNITRSKPVEMWIGFFRLDSIGNPQRIGTLYTWDAAQNATILYTYPDGRTFGAADSGKYVLSALIATSENTPGKVVNYAKIGVNNVCDFPLGVSFLTNLNTIAQTEIATAAVVQGVTVEQKEATTYENYLGFLDWGFRADLFGTPNMVLWLAAFLAFAMVLRFGGGLGRRGRDE